MPDYVSLYENKVTYAPIRTGWRAALQFRPGTGVTLTATEDPNVGIILEIAATGGGGSIGGTLGASDNVVPRSDGTGGSTLQASTMVIDDSGNVSGVTWHGNTITEIYGGTNQTAYTVGDLLYASGTNTLAKLAGNGTIVRKFLRQTGIAGTPSAPAWDTVTASDVDAVPTTRTITTTLPLRIAGGGSADLSADRTLTVNDFTGDLGSGGASGTVPAPSTGDAAALKYLGAGGTWSTPTAAGVGAIPSSYLDADGTLAANSDVKVATQKATKTYADTKIGGSTGSTDKALLRANGTGGKTAQAGSPAVLSDAGALTGLTGLTSTGAVDLSGASSLLVPASAGAAPTAAESVAYDSTRKVVVHGDGSASHVVLSGIPTVFGTGCDGAIVADGTTPFVTHGATITPTGSPGAYVYALSRPLSATNLTISSGVTIDASQYPITVSGTLTFTDSTSVISSGGANASGITAGAGIAAGGTMNGAWSQGGNGRTTAGIGPNGTNQANTMGGSGGGGGSVTGQAGGTGGAATVPGATSTYPHDSFGLLNLGYRMSAGSIAGMNGGAGGAGGGNLANSNSGAGGGGGGTLYVAAAKILGAGVFRAKGGNGGNAALLTGLGGGGGGGGGGGQVIVITIGQGYTFTTDVSGGTKGTGVGASGTDGVNGSAGTATVVSL